MIQVWKTPLRSQREDFDEEKVQRARSFCFSEGWIGIGWAIDSLSDDVTDPSLYEQAIPKTSEGYPDGAQLSGHRALAHKVQADDLVWCRTKDDVYWLGRVAGPWRYRNTGDFDDFDLYQVRRSAWQRVGPADKVPGPIKNAYAGRGSAISQIQRERVAAARESAFIWQTLTAEVIQDAPDSSSELSLSAIGHDDLEDLVILYLQAEHGWYVVPSTAKISTPITECVLRNSKGQRAYVQVKSGHTAVDANIDIPPEVDRFFVFDLVEGREELASDQFTRIEPLELEQFLRTHPFLPPPYLQRLNTMG
jgi:hypothetical protein